MYSIKGYITPFDSEALYQILLPVNVPCVCCVNHELGEKVLASREMPHGSRGLASVHELELLQTSVDLSLLQGSLERSVLQHASVGRRPKKMHSESGLGVVPMPDMESGTSEPGDSHYREVDVVYCGSDYGLDAAEEDKEAVLCALTAKYQDVPFPDVEDLEVARFWEAKQDRPSHLRCGKHQAEWGKPPGDGDDQPMREGVAPACLGGGRVAEGQRETGLVVHGRAQFVASVAPQSPCGSDPSWHPTC